jgi:hypothetical protein
MQQQMFARLAELLLNPELDRCDIADGIYGDRELVQFVHAYQRIAVEKIAPVGTSWAELKEDLFSLCFFDYELAEPSKLLVVPRITGCLFDLDGTPWFQSSPREFIPVNEVIHTTNLYGKPEFYFDLGTRRRLDSLATIASRPHLN